ncbi:CHY zinc finger protein [Auritidibacter ignavus]|uniref:CHY zinc finger protein n=1 Tax=Auritidibacter ignavus TaxID=678932 RepID=UPI0024B8C769|nr:CHY zinc finger protein [Auritidibacter ignavus]WHS29297.1 CHY zinc finger protein [Auritidibacter ignavus]
MTCDPREHVRGPMVDEQTRCVHYHTDLDIIALRFGCCDEAFWPCFQCHDDTVDHTRQPWPRNRFDEPAVLCGVCAKLMTVAQYTEASRCPDCGSLFNPGCASHYAVYFDGF